MVVIFLPTASPAVTPHDRVATSSICTVQDPHCAIPQPYFVPVMPIESRMTHNSGVSGSTSTSCVFPLMVRRSILYSSRIEFFWRYQVFFWRQHRLLKRENTKLIPTHRDQQSGIPNNPIFHRRPEAFCIGNEYIAAQQAVVMRPLRRTGR